MSKLFTINEYDLARGFIVAIVSAGLTALYNLLEMGTLMGAAEWRAVGIAGVLAGLAYLIKNVFTNSMGNLLKKESEVSQ